MTEKQQYVLDKILKNHSDDDGKEKIWMVQGEDPNPDIFGNHIEPILGCFQGTLVKVAEHAVQMKGFIQWGAGGRITPITITKL